MTREDLNKHWEIIQAFKDGFEIEFNYKDDSDSWSTVSGNVGFHFDRYEYRIKPVPEYIPFDFTDAEFLIGKVVKSKYANWTCMITACTGDRCYTGGIEYLYGELLHTFTFLDGSPCGKLKQ